MDIYLVGGAVRDEQLGIPVEERDWCVVGATPEEMLEQGYRQVGKDFPVFIHPESGEEYALARTERKTGAGYHGFSFDTSPAVAIEDDLLRRDLTINAMAKRADDALIDPFDGAADIEARLLRHVSGSFVEDPVRILRVAKFAARFRDRGFHVADETLRLMSRMVDDGEADALNPDRVWKETEAALRGPDPQVFFAILRECGALAVVYPEIDGLFGVPQPARWHPEIDCGIHTMLVLEQASLLSDDADLRFAALVHDLGKATTPKDTLPSHHGHEHRSVRLVKRLCERFPVPGRFRDLAVLVAEFHGHCHRAFELKPSTILSMFERVDAFRRPGRFGKFLLACEADARGRTGLEDQPYPQRDYLHGAFECAAAIDAGEHVSGDVSGAEIGKRLARARTQSIGEYKNAAGQIPK